MDRRRGGGGHGSREAHISGLQTECTVTLLQAGI